MARVRKPQPTQESLLFVTPEQKVLRLLISEPTTAFTPRIISSRLKGVRGLGGVEGINKILLMLNSLGMVDYMDNQRAVRIHDEHSTIQILKVLSAICDLEGIRDLLLPVSHRGILFGSRAEGKAHSGSDYNLFVISDLPDEAQKIIGRHPMAKLVNPRVMTTEDFVDLEKKDTDLKERIMRGIVLWGSA